MLFFFVVLEQKVTQLAKAIYRLKKNESSLDREIESLFKSNSFQIQIQAIELRHLEEETI